MASQCNWLITLPSNRSLDFRALLGNWSQAFKFKATNLFDVVHLHEALIILEQAEEGVVRVGQGPNARVGVVRAVLALARPLGRTFGHLGIVRTARIVSASAFAVILHEEGVLVGWTYGFIFEASL